MSQRELFLRGSPRLLLSPGQVISGEAGDKWCFHVYWQVIVQT